MSAEGSIEREALIADCTSRAAPLMSRDRSNCRITDVLPRVLLEVISVTPAMRPKARSKGVATVAAMVSGLAPGMEAETAIVGKSTCGKGETGRIRKAARPDKATAIVSNVVATGRRMKNADRFTAGRRAAPRPARRPSDGG